MRHPDINDIGGTAMVAPGYPGRMQIAGRIGTVQECQPVYLADGRTKLQIVFKLWDDSSGHGDRLPINPIKIATEFLEVCNISEVVLPNNQFKCYEHGVHKVEMHWELPTPPRFSSVEEADEWMARHEENVRVRGAIHKLKEDFTTYTHAALETARSQQVFGTSIHQALQTYSGNNANWEWLQ